MYVCILSFPTPTNCCFSFPDDPPVCNLTAYFDCAIPAISKSERRSCNWVVGPSLILMPGNTLIRMLNDVALYGCT